MFIWSKVGRNPDKHKSNAINRSFNDVTAVYNANKETKELVEKHLIRKMTEMTGKK